MRSRTLVLILTFAWCLFPGCLGLAHKSVEMPTLLVQGVLLDADGGPVAGQTLTIVLSDFYAVQETFRALTAGELDSQAYAYRFCTVQSGSAGESRAASRENLATSATCPR